MRLTLPILTQEATLLRLTTDRWDPMPKRMPSNFDDMGPLISVMLLTITPIIFPVQFDQF